jgi:hypothetical protein
VDHEGEAPEFLAAVLRLPGVEVEPPAAATEIDELEEAIAARLPAPHRALLVRANGIVAAHGYERLLGVGDAPTSIGAWNAPSTWKFAWSLPLDEYLCFAESGFGDQYAYRLTELRRGGQSIHRLERHLMEPAEQPVAPGIESFLRQFFGRAQTPSHEIIEARAQVGNIGPAEHVIASPPPLVAGREPVGLVRLPAAAAMILQGDLASQLLDPANAERDVARVVQYQDNLGRSRLRVDWA